MSFKDNKGVDQGWFRQRCGYGVTCLFFFGLELMFGQGQRLCFANDSLPLCLPFTGCFVMFCFEPFASSFALLVLALKALFLAACSFR